MSRAYVVIYKNYNNTAEKKREQYLFRVEIDYVCMAQLSEFKLEQNYCVTPNMRHVLIPQPTRVATVRLPRRHGWARRPR